MCHLAQARHLLPHRPVAVVIGGDRQRHAFSVSRSMSAVR